MASLKDLKNRIESVKNTRKITKAMQMVAAAKLRRSQEAAEMARPYSERMGAVMGNLTAGIGADNSGAPKLLAGSGSDVTHLLVVVTGERGLCGGFNANIAKLARQYANELLQDGKKVKILTVGKKGREQLKQGYSQYFVDHVDLSEVKTIGYQNAQSIANDVISRFESGEFDVATLFFSKFESVIAQVPTGRQIIPFVTENEGEAASAGASYEYEPSEEAILADLLPRAIATEIFTALLENNASFYGAQMTAMDNATRNAGEMIDSLTIQYNRSRQAAITNELIEIISGAEAL